MPTSITADAERKWFGYLSETADATEQKPLSDAIIRSRVEKWRGEKLGPDGGTSQAVIVGTRDNRVELKLPGGKLHSFPFSEIIHADLVLQYWIGEGKAPVSQDFKKPDPSIGVASIGNNSYAPILADRIRRDLPRLHDIDSTGLKQHAAKLDTEGYFDPTDREDDRQRVLREIAQRQGAPQFRAKLIDAYKARCAVTGNDAEQALEAAHISRYLGPKSNDVSNGLLLRADIHTLFDRNLLGIDPRSWEVTLAKSLQNTKYSMLVGTKLRMPEDPQHRPNNEALQERWKVFREYG